MTRFRLAIVLLAAIAAASTVRADDNAAAEGLPEERIADETAAGEALSAGPPVSTREDVIQYLRDRPTLLTDPWDIRHRLFDEGIDLDGTYYLVVQGNPVGGGTRGVSVLGALSFGLDLDLTRLLRAWRGLSLYSSFVWIVSNSDLTDDRVYNWNELNPFASGDPPDRFGLGQLYMQQMLFDDALLLQAGQVYLGGELNLSPLYLYYLNYAISPNPGSIFNSYNTFNYNPFGSLGALFKYRFLKRYYVAGGTGLVSDEFIRPENHGINLTPPGTGWATQFETGVRWAIAQEARDRSGHAWAGVYFNPSEQERIDVPKDPAKPPPTSAGTYGLYAAADQTLYRLAGASTRAIKAWVNLSWNKPSATYAPLTVATGLVCIGPWGERPRDSLAFGLFLTDFLSRTTNLGHQTQDVVLELGYNVVLARWLVVTPDLQYVFNPSGYGTIPDALVLSVMFGVTL